MMRLDYGFSGYRVPPIPRAARSARKRCLFKRKSDDNRMFSFDLLASVAGKLLSDGNKKSPQCDDANEQPAAAEDPVCKVVDEKHEEEKPGEFRDFLKSELVADSPKPKSSYFADEIDGISRLASGITSSYSSGVDDDCKLRLGIFSAPEDTEKEHKIEVKKDFVETRKMSTGNNPSLEEEWDAKPQVFVGSVVDSSSRCGSLPITRDSRVKFIRKDDDENLSGCNGFEDGKAPASSDAKLGGFKDGEQDDADNEKPGMKNRKSLRDYPLKKRKLLDYNQVGYEGTSNVHENGLNPTSPGDVVIPMTQTSPCGNRASLQSQVKLKIKSFRVPEMLIEMPETGTIGSLKRTVMEAITAVLGGGLQVGVVVQGKKIKDDAKTLLQMGISQSNTTDALTFLLEPISPPPHLKQRVSEKPTPLSSFPALPPTMMMITGNNAEVGSGSSVNNLMESDHDSAHSSPGKEVSMAQSKALVPLRKSSKSAQRRVRRPFTVAEVEALVLAVEKLGTGRWRDVKLRAFDNSKHRTYVDLKDKWKTLVHTARISPQQRRGEQVPQELLDRVLAAHALWSQQQPKHDVKPQPNTFLRI